MNKDLHDIDNLFRSSLESYEETPSPYVKERLEAALDKRDAESYKKRFLVWKRAAILLFVLLLGFTIYNAGILWTRPENSEKKHAVEKIMQPAADRQTNEKTDLSLTGKKINAPGTHSESLVVNNKPSSDKQYKHFSPTEQTNLTDDPSRLHDNRNTSFTNNRQNIPVRIFMHILFFKKTIRQHPLPGNLSIHKSMVTLFLEIFRFRKIKTKTGSGSNLIG
jgi:hypothetical protein